MFVWNGRPRNEIAYRTARRRRRDGMSFKRIARELGVSPATVHQWTRDIDLTPEQRETPPLRAFRSSRPCRRQSPRRRVATQVSRTSRGVPRRGT
ncbi:MAG: helix-turn-helix domain-containing protein [Thermoleophilaceae bacterium]